MSSLNTPTYFQVGKVRPEDFQRLLQELVDGAALFHGDAAPVPRAVPVREGDVDGLLFDSPLVLLPLLPQVLPQLVLLFILRMGIVCPSFNLKIKNSFKGDFRPTLIYHMSMA